MMMYNDTITLECHPNHFTRQLVSNLAITTLRGQLYATRSTTSLGLLLHQKVLSTCKGSKQHFSLSPPGRRPGESIFFTLCVSVRPSVNRCDVTALTSPKHHIQYKAFKATHTLCPMLWNYTAQCHRGPQVAPFHFLKSKDFLKKQCFFSVLVFFNLSTPCLRNHLLTPRYPIDFSTRFA